MLTEHLSVHKAIEINETESIRNLMDFGKFGSVQFSSFCSLCKKPKFHYADFATKSGTSSLH